jgi:methyl-accepting chemotaxis protein
MSKDTNFFSNSVIFLAGVLAAGLLTGRKREAAPSRGGRDSSSMDELRGRVTDLESATEKRLSQIEKRVEEHSAKLNEVPATEQIVGAMEQLLARTMSSLDDRLTTQAQSIDVLKTTVSQTDSLLERVLESLDSLQAYAEPELTEESLRPAV